MLRIATRVAVTSRCVRGIDERGLHKTNLAALSDVLRRVGREGCLCLSDGFPVPPTGFEQRPVVGGDAMSASIAAASVIAKVTRDRFMQRMEERYPGWEFADPRRLLDARAPRRDREARRLAAAPPVVPVDGVPAARALIPDRGSRRRCWPRSRATGRAWSWPRASSNALTESVSVPPEVAALDHPHLVAWREAFRAFGAQALPLLGRGADRAVGRAAAVNRLVDLYNAVERALGGAGRRRGPRPRRRAGVAALRRRRRGVRRRRSAEGPGEVVWADAVGVTCRRWNWRQGVRTRLTVDTTRAYFLFDALPLFDDASLAGAMEDLESRVSSLCPGAALSSFVVREPTPAG